MNTANDAKTGDESLDRFEVLLSHLRSSKQEDASWIPARNGMSGWRHPDYYKKAYAFALSEGIPIYKEPMEANMSDKAQGEFIRALTDRVIELDHYYHNLNTSLVTDAEYDAMLQQLIALEEQFPHLKCADSPTDRVAPDLSSELKRIKFEIPMMSLGKCFSPADAIEFIRKLHASADYKSLDYVAEPKLDGLAVRLVYKRGILKEATTRGDGYEGEDILRTVCRVQGVPYKLKGRGHPELLEVRGEVVADILLFSKLNVELERIGQKPYKNPRNFVSGNLRQLDPNRVHGDVMEFILYEVVEGRGMSESHSLVLDRMESYGFSVVNSKLLTYQDINGEKPLSDTIDEWKKHRIDYRCEIDGVVFKVDNYALRLQMGVTNHHPKWAIAYKFPAMSAETHITKITCSVGRTGVITPYAKLSPVDVGGVTVNFANLHNFSNIEELSIDENDAVELIRSGDVIPHIRRVVEKRSTRKFFPRPTVCPCCKGPLTVDHDKVEIYCKNDGCIARDVMQLIYYASRDCADIGLLGESYLPALYKAGFIRKPSDLYNLTVDQLATITGEKTAKKIHANIQRAKGFDLAKFLTILGIPNVGPYTATQIAEEFGTLDAILDAAAKDLWNVRRVGKSIAVSLIDYLADKRNREEIDRLISHGVTTGSVTPKGFGSLAGQTWCITGTFYKMNRKDIVKLLKQNGATVGSDVSKKTTHLLMGANPGSKLDKAMKNNPIVIIDDANFSGLESINGLASSITKP